MNRDPEQTFQCIAVDMGASNIRIMLGSVGPESLEYKEMYRFANGIIESGGHERWDIRHILGEITRGIKETASVHGKGISGIGVDSWGVDFAVLDQAGRLKELPVAYRDRRTEGMMEKWQEMMDREETFRRTGINFYIFNSLFQMLSMKGSGKPATDDRILFLPSYILYRLCGVERNELTIASTSQMLGAETGAWDEKILGHLGIPGPVMGGVCKPGTVLGSTGHGELNLPGASAIAVCEHDTASAVVSVPFGDNASVFISTGTWCIVGMESDRPMLGRDALDGGFTNERGYGGFYRFLKNIVGLWLVQGLMKSLPVRDDFGEIESLAFRYQGPPAVVNPEDPVFYNPTSMKEAFDAFFRKTGQETPAGPGGYFKCAYDSLIYSFRYHIEQIEIISGRRIGTIHLIGGGCQSDYLTRRIPSVCGRKVVSGPVEAAATGNILVQAIAMEVLTGLEDARKLVLKTLPIRSYDPEPPEAAHEALYRKFLGFLTG